MESKSWKTQTAMLSLPPRPACDRSFAQQIVVSSNLPGGIVCEQLVKVLNGRCAVISRHRLGQGVSAKNRTDNDAPFVMRKVLQVVHITPEVAAAKQIILNVRYIKGR